MHIAAAVPAFLKRYPDLTVDFSVSAKHVDLIDEDLDLAIRIGVLEDSLLVARKLVPSRLVLCGSPPYLRQHGMPLEPADLAAHNCLTTGPMPWGGEWRLTNKNREQARVAVRGTFRSNNAEMLRAAALDGPRRRRAAELGRIRAVA